MSRSELASYEGETPPSPDPIDFLAQYQPETSRKVMKETSLNSRYGCFYYRLCSETIVVVMVEVVVVIQGTLQGRRPIVESQEVCNRQT
jgi:hypothetical protein